MRKPIQRLVAMAAAITAITGVLSAGPQRQLAVAAPNCVEKNITKLGPKHLANAHGTLRVRWCITGKGYLYAITSRFDVDITKQGAMQGYDVKHQFMDHDMFGAPVERNPRATRGYWIYVGYKIQACVWEICGVRTAYHWRITINHQRGYKQEYLGKY